MISSKGHPPWAYSIHQRGAVGTSLSDVRLEDRGRNRDQVPVIAQPLLKLNKGEYQEILETLDKNRWFSSLATMSSSDDFQVFRDIFG